MRRPHIADRSRTSLGTTAPVQPGPHRMQKTSQCEVIGRRPNNFAEHNRVHAPQTCGRETLGHLQFNSNLKPTSSCSRPRIHFFERG